MTPRAAGADFGVTYCLLSKVVNWRVSSDREEFFKGTDAIPSALRSDEVVFVTVMTIILASGIFS